MRKPVAPDVRGTVHDYWIERRRIRESSRKRQATSNKLDNNNIMG